MSAKIVESTDATVSEVVLPNRTYRIFDYFGSYESNASDVQGFEVRVQTPHAITPPHYHDVDQYQVVVDGSGKLGRHRLAPGSVHYAERYTTYGPIVAGPEGLSYFTLRLVPTAAVFYMPESRQRKVQRSGASFTTSASPALRVRATQSRLLDEATGGAHAVEHCVREGDRLDLAAAASGSFLLILSGSFECEDRQVGQRTCIYLDVLGGRRPHLLGGAGGGVAVQLHFRSDMSGIPRVPDAQQVGGEAT